MAHIDIDKCNRFANLITELGFNQTEMANLLNMSTGHVSDIVNHRKNLSNDKILILSYKKNVNEEWLQSGKGDMFNAPPSDLYTLLGYKMNSLDSETEIVIKNFLLLPDEDRKKFMDFFKKIVSDLNNVK